MVQVTFRNPRAVAALAISLLALSFLPLTLAGGPNPSGPGVPVVVIDGANGQVLEPTDGVIVRNVTYDITFTNLSDLFGPRDYTLRSGSGGAASGPRDLVADLAHVGRFNVTFPSHVHALDGTWHLLNATGLVVTAYDVDFEAPRLFVTLTPSSIPAQTWSNVSAHVTDGFSNPVPDARIRVLRTDGSSPGSDVSGTTWVNGTGAPGVGQNGDYLLTVRANVHADLIVEAQSWNGGPRGTATLSVTPPPPPPPAPLTVFRMPHVQGGLVPVSVPIRVENVSNFGTATVTVRFDTTIAEVMGVANGTIPGANTTWAVDPSNGTVTVLVTTTARPGASGSFVFADLTMRAVGSQGQDTVLDIEVVELADSNASDQPAYGMDGSFRSGLLGDADGDGDVDAQDVQAIADRVVGRQGAPVHFRNADVSRDGRLTGVDSMMLRQLLAGTRSSI